MAKHGQVSIFIVLYFSVKVLENVFVVNVDQLHTKAFLLKKYKNAKNNILKTTRLY
jgi:hypothetical protein